MSRALIICTKTALLDKNSGASQRLKTITEIVRKLDYEITITSTDKLSKVVRIEWDLLVCVSYATAWRLVGRRVRAQTFWFDLCDSWTLGRLSVARTGSILSFAAYLRDILSLKIIKSPDLVTFISSRDLNAERKYLQKIKATYFVLANGRRLHFVNDSRTRRIIFVGDGKYPPNRKALKFIRKLVTIHKYLPNIFVIGDGYKDSGNSRLVILGYLPDESVYFKGDILIAPIWTGAGVKTKVVNALESGLDVITTSEGSVGISPHPKLQIANSHSDFAKKIMELINSEIDVEVDEQSIFELDESLKAVDWLKSRSKRNSGKS